MRILALDPGLKSGYALLDLQVGYHGALSLVEHGILGSDVAYNAGYAGRVRCRQYLAAALPLLPAHDEACTDRDMALYATCIPALGAFEAAHDWCDHHGLTTRGNKVLGEYPRASGIATVERLSGQSVRTTKHFIDADGSTKSKPSRHVSTPLYREVIAGIVRQPLDGVAIHTLDAIAIGIHHAHSAHGWRPAGWQPPAAIKRLELANAWLEAMKPR